MNGVIKILHRKEAVGKKGQVDFERGGFDFLQWKFFKPRMLVFKPAKLQTGKCSKISLRALDHLTKDLDN